MNSNKTFTDYIKTKFTNTKNYLGPIFSKGTNELIKIVNICLIQAKAGANIIMPVVADKVKSGALIVYAGFNVVKQMITNKIHFNFRHLVTTTSVAAVAFALTLTVTGVGRSKVSAEVLETPEVESYNDEVIEINYGDDSAIVDTVKDILAEDTGTVYEAKPITLSDGNTGYELGDYIVSVDQVPTRELKDDQITLTIQTKDTYKQDEFGKVVVADSDGTVAKESGTVLTYQLDVKYVDTQAPVIKLSETSVEIDDVDAFYRTAFVQSITDNYDGVIEDYTMEGRLTDKDEERWEPGEYTITYKATDSNGNTGQATLNVKVNETEDKEEDNTRDSSESDSGHSGATSNAPSYENAGSIVAAAMSQIGVAQDCTMLVTNSLRAVGINFHSAPAGYMALGTIVPASEAQPGDIIYYADGGAGVPHVAIYIGGGQAVHGGYLGSTVVASAWMGSGHVVIRVQ